MQIRLSLIVPEDPNQNVSVITVGNPNLNEAFSVENDEGIFGVLFFPAGSRIPEIISIQLMGDAKMIPTIPYQEGEREDGLRERTKAI